MLYPLKQHNAWHLTGNRFIETLKLIYSKQPDYEIPASGSMILN